MEEHASVKGEVENFKAEQESSVNKETYLRHKVIKQGILTTITGLKKERDMIGELLETSEGKPVPNTLNSD